MNNITQDTPKSELARGWPIILGAFLGMFFSVGTMVIYLFGLFAPEFAKEFEWGRAEVSLAVTVFAYTIVIAAPIYGYLVDRFGARRTIIVSTLLFAPAYASLYLVGSNKLHFYGTFALIAMLGAGTLPMGFNRLIIGWFDRKRGLALGLSLVSVGLAATLLPPFVQMIIDAAGWRVAVLALTLGILLVSLPGSALLLKPPPDSLAKSKVNNNAQAKVSFNKAFWVLAIFSVLSGLFLTGLLAHFVPILLDRDVSGSVAAKYASLLGVSAIIGRISIGFMVDHLFAPRVIFAFFMVTISAMLVLRVGNSEAIYIYAAIAFGLSVGAEMDVLSYLVSRYFSSAQFGKVFGLMFSAFMIGSANGPLMLGIFYDQLGNYTSALLIMAIIALLAALSALFMPKFPTETELAK